MGLKTGIIELGAITVKSCTLELVKYALKDAQTGQWASSSQLYPPQKDPSGNPIWPNLAPGTYWLGWAAVAGSTTTAASPAQLAFQLSDTATPPDTLPIADIYGKPGFDADNTEFVIT